MASPRRVALSDLMTPSRTPVTVDRAESYPNLGIYSFGRGVFSKPPIQGAETSASTLYRVQAGQIIYSRLFAFEGAFAIVPPELDGACVSNEYPTFDVDTAEALPPFVALVLTRAATWRALASMTVGLGHRRQRLQPEALLNYEINLPALEVQREIVHDIELLDQLPPRYEEEARTLRQLYTAAREELLAGHEPRAVAELVDRIETGRSPKSLDRAPVAGERGVLKVSAVRQGEFRPAEAKAVSPDVEFPERALVQRGDLIITRANTRQLVGASCIVDHDVSYLYLCDKTLRLVPKTDEVDPRFLMHALGSAESRDQIEAEATGASESMKNISQAIILGLEVSVPPLDAQHSIATTLDGLNEARITADALAARSREVRVATLEALLRRSSARAEPDPAGVGAN